MLVNTFAHPVSIGIGAAITVLFLVGIATVHALQRYSLKQFLIFFAITFIVSNIYENLSILTGFPFGHYHYTDVLGPKLFLVPLIITPAYFGAGYLSWSLAHILLGVFGNKLRNEQIWRVPLIAAFIMVMWDMQFDPITATITKQWIWHDGGSYFGVPFVNFMGWLLCVFTIYQIFAIYISRQSVAPGQEEKPDTTDRSYWYQAAILYLILSLFSVTLALTGQHVTVTDATGVQWQTKHIFECMALVAIFTMWFVALLSLLVASKHRP
jgi:uncharacterized membrane protein